MKKETDYSNAYPHLTEDFSVERFEFGEGSIDKENSLYNINIPVSKFVLDGEIVETAIRLDSISLPESLISCIGKTINFPLNPEEGYIGGSIFLKHSHNPIHVTQLKLMQLENEKLAIENFHDI